MESFRALSEEVSDYVGDDLYRDVLEPRIPAAKALLLPLNHFHELRHSLPGEVAHEDLWVLFSLSVLNDQLLRPLQLSRGEYRQFFTELGFTCFDAPSHFNPMLCEIVDVGNWPKPDDGIEVGNQSWPGLLFGEMVFSRCAVDVYCSASHGIVEGIADRSVLYFTNSRMRRETDDPSHGWGSNSRWRTDFFRNYLTGGFSFLNVDGEVDLAIATTDTEEKLATDNDGITIEEAKDLLLHRCFVRFPERPYMWPYKWKLAIANSELPWLQNCSNVVPFQRALSLAKVLPSSHSF